MNPTTAISSLVASSMLAEAPSSDECKPEKTYLGSREKAQKNLRKLIEKSGDKNMYEADYEYAVFVVSISKEKALELGLVPKNLKDQLPDSENLTFGISFLNHAGNLKDGSQKIPYLENTDNDEENHHYGEVVVNLILPGDKTYYLTQNILVDRNRAYEKGNELGISKTKISEICFRITENDHERKINIRVKEGENVLLGFNHKSFGMPMPMQRKQKFSGDVEMAYESRYQKARIGFGGVQKLEVNSESGDLPIEVKNLQNLFHNGKVKAVLTGRAESVWEVLGAAAENE